MSGVQINGNISTLTLVPVGKPISIKVKTNSNFTQRVTITDGSDQIGVFTGSGQNNTIIGQTTATVASRLQAKSEYSSSAGSWSGSGLNSGGPYVIESYNMIVVVAENRDDRDYNDCIDEFSWSSK